MRARFVHRAQVASHAEGFARELRQGVENRAPIVRTRETNARTNALLVSGGARAVIAAEADTPEADARCIEIAAAGDPIDDRCRRDFVVAANRKAVFGFALTRTVDQQRGHAAREERQLVGFELFLGGVEPGNHHDDRRARGGTRGPTQDPSEVIAFKGNLDALARRAQVRQRKPAALHRLHVRSAHLVDIVDEQELREVVIHPGAAQVLARGEAMALGERVAPELLVDCRARRPRRAPVLPPGDAARHLLEVGEQHAVGDEPRRPMGDRSLDSKISHACGCRHAAFTVSVKKWSLADTTAPHAFRG